MLACKRRMRVALCGDVTAGDAALRRLRDGLPLFHQLEVGQTE